MEEIPAVSAKKDSTRPHHPANESLGMTEKTVVVIFSIGDRPWFGITKRWAEYFCKKWNYELKIFNSVSIDKTLKI